MAITFSIQPNPHWVIIDNFSKLPAGASIYTYRSLDPTTFKPAFQDAAGAIPYGQPIVGFGNGTMPPIFWEFDSNNPTDTYYIRVYDSDDPQTQQFLWDFNGLSGAGGGGGGSIITINTNQNFVINGVFYRNIGDTVGTPSLPTSLTLAPSNNAGYVNDPVDILFGPTGPDIIFAKNNTSATDTIDFVNFTPPGTNDLAPDITPNQFLRYICGGAGAVETFKYVQFPISLGVQSLSQQPVSVRLWARCIGGNSNITVSLRQFYGSGGAPSADQVVVINNINLTANWNSYVVNGVIVPDATTKTIGACKNDALFLQINLPLNNTTTIDLVKPSLYLGQMAPIVDYATFDMINAISDTARTGDIRTSLNNFTPYGWVIMNDGTIGNAGSVSAFTSRANVDTFPLFDLIWNTFQGNQGLAPMLAPGSVGPIITYGASSVADFTANNQILLTRTAGRLLAAVGTPTGNSVPVTGGSNTGTNWAIGQTTGNERHTQAPNEVGAHVHPAASGNFYTNAATSLIAAGANFNISAQAVTGTNAPNSVPFNVQQPVVYLNVFVKL